jgi:hypothetical protein
MEAVLGKAMGGGRRGARPPPEGGQLQAGDARYRQALNVLVQKKAR